MDFYICYDWSLTGAAPRKSQVLQNDLQLSGNWTSPIKIYNNRQYNYIW